MRSRLEQLASALGLDVVGAARLVSKVGIGAIVCIYIHLIAHLKQVQQNYDVVVGLVVLCRYQVWLCRC